MKTTTLSTLIMAALPSAFAAQAYIPYAWNETQPEIHGKPVDANNLAFWIDKPVTATCPSWDSNCPSKNITIISGPTGQHDFWMGILADGGQGMYSNIPGKIQYSAVNTDNAASTTKPSFSPWYVEQDNTINATVLRFATSDTGHFAACAEDGAYRVWAWADGDWRYEPGPCYEFEMVLVDTTAAAVDYYN